MTKIKTLRNGLTLGVCILLSFQAMAIGGLLGKLTGTDGPPKPIALETGTNRADAFAQAVNDSNALRPTSKPFSGPASPVALSSVKLSFVTDTSASSSSGNAGVDVNYKLLGVSAETMQAIGDDFADNLRVALKEQGYPVLETEKMLSNDVFRAAVAEAPAAKTGASGLLGAGNGLVTVIGKGTADTYTMTGYSKEIGLAKEFGAILVKANITLNFASFENTRSFDKAEITHGVRLSVSPKSVIDVRTESDVKHYEFMKVVELPSKISSGVVKASRSTGQTALLIFNALNGNAGSISNYEVTAVDNYRDVVSSDLKMLAELVAQVLQKQ